MKKTSILVILVCLINCKAQDSLQSDKEKIIATMIDKNAYPLIPPPPLEESNVLISKNIKDSLDKVQLKIAIYPKLRPLNRENYEDLPSFFDKYLDLITKKDTVAQKVKLKSINSKKGHLLILVDTIALRQMPAFEDFDLLFWFSKIHFNPEKDKAVFNLGISRDKLAGYSTLYALKKEEGEWKVAHWEHLQEW